MRGRIIDRGQKIMQSEASVRAECSRRTNVSRKIFFHRKTNGRIKVVDKINWPDCRNMTMQRRYRIYYIL